MHNTVNRRLKTKRDKVEKHGAWHGRERSIISVHLYVCIYVITTIISRVIVIENTRFHALNQNGDRSNVSVIVFSFSRALNNHRLNNE